MKRNSPHRGTTIATHTVPAEIPSPKHRTILLAESMRKGLASKILDRRYKLKLYKQCVTSADVILWLMTSNSSPITTSDGASVPSEQSDEFLEETAVDLANEMIDSGYLGHVKKDHRFEVGEKRLLYFKFNDDLMDVRLESGGEKLDDAENLTRVQTEMMEEIREVKAKVERMEEESAWCHELLHEAHGKIVLLEAGILSLVFITASFVVVGVSTVAAGYLGSRQYGFFVSALLTFVFSRYGVGVGHFEVLSTLTLSKTITDVDTMTGSDDDRSQSSFIAERSIQKRRSVLSTKEADTTIRMREWDTLPPPSKWPNSPMFVCANSSVSDSLVVPDFGNGAVPLGVPFHFSSELFEGTAIIRLRNVTSDNPQGDRDYFKGRRRCFQSIIQGRFKEKLPLDEVLTGHEFVRSLKRLPASWIIRAGTLFIQRLAPGAVFDLMSKQPKSMAILAATAQAVSVDMPGSEPDIKSHQIQDDCSLLGGFFQDNHATQPISISQRKKYLSLPKRAAKFTYDTESIYTFDFYQDLLDLSTYSLDLGFTNVGLMKHLDGQPVQVLAKCKDGRYLWSFQIWHEKMVADKVNGIKD